MFIPLFLFFHPSIFFGGPYLPHTGSDFDDSHIIGFVLASSTQIAGLQPLLEIVILGV